MRPFRTILSIAVTLALAGGYLASQVYAFKHEATEWARLIDTPAISWTALAVLVAALALSFVQDREENP